MSFRGHLLHKAERCTVCGRDKIGRDEGTAYMYLEKGTFWSDCIGNGATNHLILSERVIETWHKEGIQGFDAQPVVIAESKSKKLKIAEAPRYYYINISGRMSIDLQASRDARVDVCQHCFQSENRAPHPMVKYVPREKTWDGSDIFGIQNIRSGWGRFCSLRIIELAREHRWTNFRFIPMDALIRHTIPWRGVDYLGRKWPPKEWYHPAPSAGRTLEQLLAHFEEHPDYTGWPFDGLLDYEEQTIPPMLAYLHGDSAVHRENAACILYFLWYRCGVPLPEGTEDDLRRELPELYVYR